MISIGGQRDALAVAPARSESLVASRAEIVAEFGDPSALVVDAITPEDDFGGFALATEFSALRFLLVQETGAFITTPFPDVLADLKDLAAASLFDSIVATVDGAIDAALAALNADLAATNLLIVQAEGEVASARSDLNTAFADIAANGVQLVNLQSDLGTTSASLKTEVLARTAQGDALAGQVTTANAQVGFANANLTIEIAVRAGADYALAGEITTLNVSLGSTSASLTTEIITRTSADVALAADITTLTASVASANASISSEAIARATADTALSALITSLTATVFGNTADISSEAVARASADSALAANITTTLAAATRQRVYVQGTAPSGGTYALGDLWFDTSAQAHPYYWNGSAWTDNSDGRFATISASVTTEQAARIAADSVFATDITSINTTLSGHTASISTMTSSLNGLMVEWSVKATLNGTSGHLEFVGLQQADGTGAIYVFDILANVNIHGVLVVDGTIINGKYADESVTALRSHSDGSTYTGNGVGGAGVSVFNWTFNIPHNGPFLIQYSCGVNIGGGGNIAGPYIYIDGTLVDNSATTTVEGNSFWVRQLPVTPGGSGNHTLTVSFVDLAVGGSNTIFSQSATVQMLSK